MRPDEEYSTRSLVRDSSLSRDSSPPPPQWARPGPTLRLPGPALEEPRSRSQVVPIVVDDRWSGTAWFTAQLVGAAAAGGVLLVLVGVVLGAWLIRL